jgi:phosphoglucosamine mutase
MSKFQRRWFGTDGIRGPAGVEPLTAQTTLVLGIAAAEVLCKRYGRDGQWPLCVIGKDTRQSGDMLENAIAAGLSSRGVDVRLAGVVPTPAVAILCRELGATFGIVISASHNPAEDNGVKFFGADGYKLDDTAELEIEAVMESIRGEHNRSTESTSKVGRIAALEDAAHRYEHSALASVHDNVALLEGMTIALDSSNGAAFETSHRVLKKLGAKVLSFFDQPNGLNINRDCGCTHPEVIENLVKENVATIGLSHDGDADRLLLCDETGSALDGDELLAIAAADMIERGDLKNNTLVATVMSNFGLDDVLRERGGKVLRTGVGDRYVIEAMCAGDYNLGGEQSGHLIFRDYNSTGDGLIAALQILQIVQRRQQPLSELRKILSKFPQAQRNIRVASKPALDLLVETQKRVAEIEQQLGDAGRVLLRYSGTENLARLLIEGRDASAIEAQADSIVELLKAETEALLK